MSNLAYADVAVPRDLLNERGRKFAIRQQLLAKMAEMGHIETVVAYAIDPTDGPFFDGTYQEINRDKYAVIRLVARVTPFTNQKGS